MFMHWHIVFPSLPQLGILHWKYMGTQAQVIDQRDAPLSNSITIRYKNDIGFSLLCSQINCLQ